MNGPSGVSRRIEQCVDRLRGSDCEGALVNLFPAIDKTAKRRRPKEGVGKRIKAFLQDEEIIISAIGARIVMSGCYFDGTALHDALYDFGRTTIAHEGELDPRLSFNDDRVLQIGQGKWNLPSSFISGMALAVIIAPENGGERTQGGLGINVFEKIFLLNDIWGKPGEVHAHVCGVFRNPNLFARRT